jgi:hypothetical protein
MREGAVVILRDGRDFTPLEVRERVCVYVRMGDTGRERKRVREKARQRDRERDA